MRLVMLRFVLTVDDMLVGHYTEDGKVGFWYIPREYNQLADRLAKSAARMASKD